MSSDIFSLLGKTAIMVASQHFFNLNKLTLLRVYPSLKPYILFIVIIGLWNFCFKGDCRNASHID